MIGPIVEELAGDYAGKAVIGKVDVDSNPLVASQLESEAFLPFFSLKKVK
jgi:thioredoxin-like negative regulator of GroEL